MVSHRARLHRGLGCHSRDVNEDIEVLQTSNDFGREADDYGVRYDKRHKYPTVR
jgi:hypothetical protein